MSEEVKENNSKRKKLVNYTVGSFFGVQIIALAIWGVSYLYYSMSKIIYDFGDIFLFGDEFIYVVISLVFFLAIEIYVYTKLVKKRKLRTFNEQLKYYNELISKSPKLKCLICNDSSQIEILSFSWKYGLLSDHFGLKKPGFKTHTIMIPFCQKCSQNLGAWRMTQSIGRLFPIALIASFVLILYLVFIIGSFVFIIELPLYCILRVIFIDLPVKVTSDPDFYIYGHLSGEITVIQDVSTKPIPYDVWIRSA